MSENTTAKIKRKTEFAGIGCLIQAIGLALLFWFPIGTFLGLVLLVYGSIKSTRLICGNCGNRIDSKTVRVCPSCKATLFQ